MSKSKERRAKREQALHANEHAKLSGPQLDLNGLQLFIDTASKQPLIHPAPTLQSISQQLEHLTQRLESMQNDLNRIESQFRQDTRAAAIEIGGLRHDLKGEQRALSALSVFNGVVPMLDSLSAIRTAIQDQTESAFYRQVNAVISGLRMMLRGLGFSEFEVTVGEPFDPHRMECMGYAAGAPGVVLSVMRTGYSTSTGVVRPVGVLVADPNVPELST
jgi:molecular chaperone GrpE (heat shock protein)